jgi:hypothetical protein
VYCTYVIYRDSIEYLLHAFPKCRVTELVWCNSESFPMHKQVGRTVTSVHLSLPEVEDATREHIVRHLQWPSHGRQNSYFERSSMSEGSVDEFLQTTKSPNPPSELCRYSVNHVTVSSTELNTGPASKQIQTTVTQVAPHLMCPSRERAFGERKLVIDVVQAFMIVCWKSGQTINELTFAQTSQMIEQFVAGSD